jgi:signal transduction histidine kinase
VKAELTEAQQATRNVTASLQPPAMEVESLWAAFSEPSRPLTEAGIEVDLEGKLPEALDPDVARTVYCVVREALGNVRRHADAKFVRVSTRAADGHLVVKVQDDGRGFQTRPVGDLVRDGHFGVASMHERMSLADGGFSITSRPGRGTIVRLEIALSNRSTPAAYIRLPKR